MSISKRITWFSTVWMLLLLIVVNGGIYLFFGHLSAQAELDRVQSQTQTIAEAIRPDRVGTNNPGDMLRAYTPSNGLIRVIRENGNPFITTTKHQELIEMPVSHLTRQKSEQLDFKGNLYAVSRLPLIWIDGSVVTLEYVEQMVIYESTLSTLRMVLFISSIIVLVPVFFAGQALSRVILRPIQQFITTMNTIRKKGTFERIDVPRESRDELDQMGQTFNQMMQLLEENYEKQQQFVSDASHELRTPLTIIESYANLIKRWGKSKPELLDEAIEAICEESQRMKGLTQQMLAATSHNNQPSLELKELDITKLIRDIAKRLEQTFHREIDVQSNSRHLIKGDEDQIKQLIFILLENGLKYSDLALTLGISNSDSFVKIDVRDHGIGIPEDDIPYVFERFFRVDKARSRQTGGSGLGLAIAKQIVLSHKGQIRVNSLENVGTTFTVLLPIVKDKEEIDV